MVKLAVCERCGKVSKHYIPDDATDITCFDCDRIEMDEVIALEKEIKALLPKKEKSDWTADGKAIMTGKPTIVQGTRLERLRKIAEELRKA